MDHIQKAKGVADEMSWDMHLSGIPDWYIESCRKLSYLYPKAHAAEYMFLYWKLAYYKLHYPDEYLAALSDAEKSRNCILTIESANISDSRPVKHWL